MFAFIGLSRFPVFFSRSEILGSHSAIKEFNEYVYALPRDAPSTAFYCLDVGRITRRFVIGRTAVNPSLRGKRQVVPSKLYVFPDSSPDEPFSCDYSIGFVVKGLLRPAFVPLVSLHSLSKREAESLIRVFEVKAVELDDMILCTQKMGVEVSNRRDMADGGVAMVLKDSYVSGEFAVLLDRRGRLVDTNVCFDSPGSVYLPELVVLIRESAGIHIHPISEYSWGSGL